MRTSFLAFLIALIAAAGILPAQSPGLPLTQSPMPTSGRAGRVRGFVIDSLLGDVLPRATIHIMPLGRTAQSDSAGRFVIDSVPPGEWVLSFTHPSLDSIGYTNVGTRIRVFAGATTTATLSTSSFEVLRAEYCADTPDSLSQTLTYGGVYSADDARLVIDVAVSWISASDAPRPGTVRTVSLSGRRMWIACGIPWGTWIHASMRDSARVASAFLQLGPRGIVMHDLVLSSGVTILTGVVRDQEGRPVSNARVSVVGTDLAAESDRAGAFAIASTPNGSVTLDVRAAGHRPWLAAIRGNSERLDVRLQPLEQSAEDGPRGSDYLRLLQRSNRPGLILLAGPGLAEDSSSLAQMMPPNTCRWWLDGRPVDRDFFLAQPRHSWRAVELYARGADAPPEYRTADCAIALLWTAAADW